MARNKYTILLMLVAALLAGCAPAAPTASASGAQTTQTIPPTTAVQTGTAATEPTVPAGPAGIEFLAQEARKAKMQYSSGLTIRPDGEALLLKELDWNLSAEAPTVLIVHTHATESYTKQSEQDYKESEPCRTLNTAYNTVAVGDLVEKRLTEAGICVLHDRSLHDYPSYNSAYSNSRQSVEDYLQRYPSIQVVLDLHRDAVTNNDGSLWGPTVEVDGQKVARLMLVIGGNNDLTEDARWQENLAAALKVQVLLERATPGITRATYVRTSKSTNRFNQDLSTGSMLVEVGTSGNTLQEALAAAELLADALIQLKYGAQ